jgi:hypothetical protein
MMKKLRNKIERRILTRFVDWVEKVDGPGSFTNVLRGKVEIYLCGEPPLWQRFPFADGQPLSDW